MQAQRLVEALASQPGTTVVSPPGDGPGHWAGGPSVVHDDDGFHLAYRLRRPVTEGRGYANVVAHSADGVRFTSVATVPAALFGSASLERPALVRRPDGGWRLYVSCSTPGSKHWWVEALDADSVEGLPEGTRTVVLPGDAATAWKDVVVSRDDAGWRMWACRHPLDGGDDEADRMQTWYAQSSDGLDWSLAGPALVPTPGGWDARGTRVTSVWHDGRSWQATYDGRASAQENWYERTGWATGDAPGALRAQGGPVPAAPGTLRYVAVAAVDGGLRAYYEAARSDGSNELRTVFVTD